MRVFLVLLLPLHHRSHGPSGDEPVCVAAVAGVHYQIAGVWNAGGAHWIHDVVGDFQDTTTSSLYACTEPSGSGN
jgi:hypothetical protein